MGGLKSGLGDPLGVEEVDLGVDGGVWPGGGGGGVFGLDRKFGFRLLSDGISDELEAPSSSDYEKGKNNMSQH